MLVSNESYRQHPYFIADCDKLHTASVINDIVSQYEPKILKEIYGDVDYSAITDADELAYMLKISLRYNYYWYMRHDATATTPQGQAINTDSNIILKSSADKMIFAINEMADLIDELSEITDLVKIGNDYRINEYGF